MTKRCLDLKAFGFVLLALLLAGPVTAAKDPKPLVLAPTGFLGIFYPAWPHEPKEIEVRVIEKGSPSDGTELKVGDRIVGIGDEKFTEHPWSALVKAIDFGEANDGNLPLLLKDGKKVVIRLEKLGAYSATAPYNCPKTDKIIARTAELLAKDETLGQSATRTGLLGLMATGEKKYIDVVARRIQGSEIAKPDAVAIDNYLASGQGDMGMVGWTWGYNLICLGEYYLLTKDESVLPAIRTYALGLARGQDVVGLWGHRMARNGRAPGYGIMNQPSLSSFMGMIFAKKCGIEDPVLARAIEKTYAYVVDHVDKGGFPYGVHGPAEDQFNNNGTSGSAAICMSLMGNQHGASYFSKIAAPTHDKLTLGHASHFFNPLWTPLGASLSGPEVTQRFFKESMWYFNGKRHWKGGFPDRDNAGFVAAQALLMYCLPRKALLITGREADKSIWVNGGEAEDLINMCRIDYKTVAVDKLFEMFNSPFSQVRGRAAGELSGRLNKLYQFNKQNGPDLITPRLLALIKEGSERQRITALACLGGATGMVIMPKTEVVAALMNNKQEPLAVRVAAALAIGAGNCREAALPYYNDLLRMVLEQRSEPDPFGHVDRKLSLAITGISKNLTTADSREDLKADKALIYMAAMKLLDHKRQDVREVGIKLLKDIPLEDFHIVGDKLMHVLKNKDPSYHSYSSALNADGIEILANLNIREGLDLLEDGIFHGDGKWGFKYRALISALPKYGANAKPYIEKFEALPNVNKKGDRFTPDWQKAVKVIRADENPKKLITVEEAMKIGKEKSGSQ